MLGEWEGGDVLGVVGAELLGWWCGVGGGGGREGGGCIWLASRGRWVGGGGGRGREREVIEIRSIDFS